MNKQEIIKLLKNFDLKVIADATDAEYMIDSIIEHLKNSGSLHSVIESHSCSNCRRCVDDDKSGKKYCLIHDKELFKMFDWRIPIEQVGCNQWRPKECLSMNTA